MSGFVLITRHPSDCGELQGLLDACDLKLRAYPVLRLREVTDDDAWERIVERTRDQVDGTWVVMASPRAPERFVAACRRVGVDALLDLPVAVVGESTAAASRSCNLRVDQVGPGTGAGLARQLLDLVEHRTRFVIACGRDRRPELTQILADAGHEILPVIVYQMDPTPARELPPLGPSLEAVILTSPRAAELYLSGVGGFPLPCQHWALGPTTQSAAAAIGIDCLIPTKPNFKSLAEELCKN